jgi:hypothetical protein
MPTIKFEKEVDSLRHLVLDRTPDIGYCDAFKFLCNLNGSFEFVSETIEGKAKTKA